MSNLWITAARPLATKRENIDSHLLSIPFYGRKDFHSMTADEFAQQPGTYWHGSPNGVAGLKAAHYGVHVGTQQAAREALNARIGTRADGKDWDGTREYGKTLLAGYATFQRRGEIPTGQGHRDRNVHDHLPTGTAEYSSGEKIPLSVKPHLFPVRIVGGMTNSPGDPHPDWHANGYMTAQIKQGRARNGYYYRNEGEDAGSISAVVPNADHLATHEDFVRHAHALGWDIHPDNARRYGLS